VPVKPVASLLTVRRELVPRALARLAEHFGPPDMVSPWWPFPHTDYYVPEMGVGLERCLASFLHLADPEFLPHLKLVAHRLEQALSLGGRRLLNLDVGYLTGERLVLATGKNFRHRLYLSHRIYGEVTLMAARGGFTPLPWTYPDYAGAPLLPWLERVRRKYLWQLRQWRQMVSEA
jgi:hypothetical protein